MEKFVSAIILAAGQGTRMGRQKLLLQLEGRTLIERVTDAVVESQVGEVVVVLGAQAGVVAGALGSRPVRLVHNPGYRSGQSTSLVAGVKAADRRAGVLMIVLADQPFLSAALIDRLIDFYYQHSYLIVRPAFRGVPGHPVLMDASLAPDLLKLTGDTGAREIIARCPGQVGLLPLTDETGLLDVDTPADYLRLTRCGRIDT